MGQLLKHLYGFKECNKACKHCLSPLCLETQSPGPQLSHLLYTFSSAPSPHPIIYQHLWKLNGKELAKFKGVVKEIRRLEINTLLAQNRPIIP